MYVKITGNLIDVLGDKARGDIEAECGIRMSPLYQNTDGDEIVTLAEVVNEQKAYPYLNHPRVEVIQTKEEANIVIDEVFTEKYTLVDSTALLLSLQLSGKSAAEIEGYDVAKPMEHQDNLRALYEAGLSGITKIRKPPYFT